MPSVSLHMSVIVEIAFFFCILCYCCVLFFLWTSCDMMKLVCCMPPWMVSCVICVVVWARCLYPCACMLLPYLAPWEIVLCRKYVDPVLLCVYQCHRKLLRLWFGGHADAQSLRISWSLQQFNVCIPNTLLVLRCLNSSMPQKWQDVKSWTLFYA